MKKAILILLFILPLIFFYVFSHKIDIVKKKTDSQITLDDSFEQLEGYEIEDWNYIQTQRDYQDLEHYKELYEKNYKQQFNCNLTFKIPTIVHLVWLGPTPFPIGSVFNIRSWIAHHPDWTFKFWTDRNRPPPCHGMQVHLLGDFVFQFLKEKFNETNSWRERSDIWRYEILYQEGGLCIDHDSFCIRPFHGFHTGYDFYAALEVPHEEIESLALSVGNGVVGAKAQHPVLLATIRSILERWDEVSQRFCALDLLIQARRSILRTFIVMTLALEKGLNQPGNTDIIFPASYFYPKKTLPGFYSKRFRVQLWDKLNRPLIKQHFYNELRHICAQDLKILYMELFSLFAMIGCFLICCLIKREKKLCDKRQ